MSILSEIPGPSAHAELLIAIKSHPSPHQQAEVEKEMDVIIENMPQQAPSKHQENKSNEEELVITDGGIVPGLIPTLPMSVKTQLCGVCFDEFESSSTLNQASPHITNPCQNFSCCSSCFHIFLSVKVKEKSVGVKQLLCPGGCGESLIPEDVRKILGDSWFGFDAMADRVVARSKLLSDYEVALIEADQVEATKNRRLNRRLPSLSASLSTVKFHFWAAGKDIQRCNGCHMMIEKNGGCNHMTCQHCKHEFHWCCGQNYKNKHYDFICFPTRYSNQRSMLWGPVLPVRIVTKATVLVLALGFGTVGLVVGGVCVGTVLVAKKVSNRCGYDAYMKRVNQARTQRQMEARLVRQVEARREQVLLEIEQRKDDLLSLKALFVSYKLSCFGESPHKSEAAEVAAAEDDTGLEVNDSTIEMMSRIHYATLTLCLHCESAPGLPCSSFTTPLALFHHLQSHHHNAPSETDGETDSMSSSIMNNFIETQLVRPHRGLYSTVSPLKCSFLMAENKPNSSSNSHDDDVVQHDIAHIRSAYARFRDRQVGTITVTSGGATSFADNMVPQRCPCGAEFDGIESWCDHMASHTSAVAAKAIHQPTSCMVAIRPGYLCNCRRCNDPTSGDGSGADAASAFCLECAHPRMLHSNCISNVTIAGGENYWE